MFDRVLSMPPVLNIPGFWIAQDAEYVFVVLTVPEFWIYQNYEYARITQGSEYAWIISEYAPEYAWFCLDMSEYA